MTSAPNSRYSIRDFSGGLIERIELAPVTMIAALATTMIQRLIMMIKRIEMLFSDVRFRRKVSRQRQSELKRLP